MYKKKKPINFFCYLVLWVTFLNILMFSDGIMWHSFHTCKWKQDLASYYRMFVYIIFKWKLVEEKSVHWVTSELFPMGFSTLKYF